MKQDHISPGRTTDVKVRMRARRDDDATKVTVLIVHPMETGLRTTDSGTLIPAHIITDIVVRYRDRVIFEADMTIAIAKDPLISFRFLDGSPGETVQLEWKDDRGNTGHHETTIS